MYDDHYNPYEEDERQFFPGAYIGLFPGGGFGGGFGSGPGFPGLPPFPGGGGNGPGYPGPPPFPGGGGGPGFPGPLPFPGGGGGQGAAPAGPPPSFTPEPQLTTYAVDPGAIRGCLYRYTYVWLRRSSFWFYPTYVGRNSVSGYRWTGYRWSYYGIDLDHIQSFQCF